MAGFEIVFEALDAASPTIQRLSQQFIEAAEKSDKFAGVVESATKRADDGLKQVPPQAQNAAKSLAVVQQAGQQLLTQLVTLASVAGVVTFFKQTVDAALQEEEALRRVAFSVQATGSSFAKEKDRIVAFAEEQQSLTQFSSNQTYEAFGRLVRITGDVGQAMQATRLVFGLASASGKDFNVVLDLLGPILNGDSTRLRALKNEFGAFIGDAHTAQQVTDALSKQFLGAAEHTGGYSQTIASLQHQLEDFEKRLGTATVPVMQALLQVTLRVAEGFEVVGTVIGGFMAGVVTQVQGLGHILTTLFTANLKDLPKAFEDMGARFADVVEGTFDNVAEVTKRYSDKQVDTVKKAGDKQTQIYTRVSTEQKKAAEEAHEFVSRLQADQLEAERKHLDSKLKMIDVEKQEKLRQVQELKEKGLLTQQEVAAAEATVTQTSILRAREARAEFDVTEKTAKEVSEAMARSVASATADMILEGKSFEKAMKEVFDTVLRTAIETFTRVVIEAAIAKEASAAIVAGETGGGGGFFGGLLGFAEGGVVTKPTVAMVGESGPEAIIPLNRVAKSPAPAPSNDLTVNQTNHITVNGQTSQEQIRQIMKGIADATRSGAAEGVEMAKSLSIQQARVERQAV